MFPGEALHGAAHGGEFWESARGPRVAGAEGGPEPAAARRQDAAPSPSPEETRTPQRNIHSRHLISSLTTSWPSLAPQMMELSFNPSPSFPPAWPVLRLNPSLIIARARTSTKKIATRGRRWTSPCRPGAPIVGGISRRTAASRRRPTPGRCMKFWFSDLELWGHGGTSCLCCVFEILVFYSLQVLTLQRIPNP